MISVIVPIYNSENYLHSCINSILCQSFNDFELILVNDGSTDSSIDICKEYDDIRIVIISTEENRGVSHARNMGLSIANGEYITFVDSDDTLPDNALLSMHEAINATNVDMIIGSYMLIYGNKRMLHSQRLGPGLYEFKSILSKIIDDGTLSGFLLGSVCGSLYKTKIIKDNKLRFNEKIKNNEDGLFNFEYALNSEILNVIKNVVYNYHQHENSSSSRETDSKVYNKLIYEYISSVKWDKNLYDFDCQFQKRNVSLALWDILNCKKTNNFRESMVFIKNRLNEQGVNDGICDIRYRDLPKHKKLFFFLMKNHCYVTLCLLVWYVVPFLQSKITR